MAGLRAQNLPRRQAYQACRIRRQAATWPASPATARTYPASTSADVLAGRHGDGRATNLLDPGLGAINRYRKRPASQARVRSGPCGPHPDGPLLLQEPQLASLHDRLAAYRFSGPLSAHLAAGRLMCADHRHLASVINHTLAAIDELTVSPGEAVRGEDVLKMMAVSLEPSGDSQRPG